MMNLSELLPEYSNRATFIGMTGSGKTTLAKFLLGFYPHVVAIDPKGTLGYGKNKWKDYKAYKTLRELTKAREPRLIYSPNAKELRDEKCINDFFTFCYMRRNTVVYVDEVTSVARNQNIPYGYQDCLTRGRERNVMVFQATQRPFYVPNFIFSETEDFFVFLLQMENDRKKVQGVTNVSEENIANLAKHEFYYSKFGEVQGVLKLKL